MRKINSLFLEYNPNIIIDSIDNYKMLKSSGYNVSLYSESNPLPYNAIFVQIDGLNYTNFNNIFVRRKNQNTRMLRVPIVTFEHSERNIVYSLSQIFHCNFTKVFEVKKELFKILENRAEEGIKVTTEDKYVMQCQLAQNASYKYPQDEYIGKGELRSIAEYLEVSYDYIPSKPDSFVINGQFACTGCIYAILPDNTVTTTEHKTLAKDIHSKLLQSTNAVITIKDNFAISFLIDGVEHIDQLREIVGKKYGLRIIELAFGLNHTVYSKADWKINSQLNEGCLGVHIGFSDAKSGIHIDFIAPSNDLLSMVEN